MKTGMIHLFIPGPTNVPERVRMAMNVPMQDMRAPDFGALTLPIFEDLKRVLQNRDGPGVRLSVLRHRRVGGGDLQHAEPRRQGADVALRQFSHLWVEMAERLGLDVHVIDVPWGEGVPVEQYERILREDSAQAIRAVFVTHNETATGVTSDVAGVRRALDAAGHPAMLFVDGVSSIASIDFRMEEWGVDLAVTGSQKGLMMPAGLGVLGVSAKALEASKGATMRRAYFEFSDMVKMNADGYFPYTPATQLLHGLRAALDLLFEEGLDTVFARHARLRKACDAASRLGAARSARPSRNGGRTR